ncbi:MAG: Lipocalin-like domain [Bacteroidota bacterium]|jgi:hypothetical protein
MKSLAILFVFIALGISSSYAQDTKSVQKPPKKVYGGKDDNCMLNGQYNKPLTINSMSQNKAAVTLNKADFIQFNADGTYLQHLNGTQTTGTWSYDESTKKITVDCGGKTQTFDAIKQTNGRIELNDGKTSILLNKN